MVESSAQNESNSSRFIHRRVFIFPINFLNNFYFVCGLIVRTVVLSCLDQYKIGTKVT